MLLTICGVLTSASPLVACSGPDLSQEVEASETFNRYANRESYGAAYAMVDRALRSEAGRHGMYGVLQRMHKRLGIEQNMTLRRYDVVYRPSRGDIVRLRFDVQYDKGKGAEEFVWRRTTNGPVLESFAVSERG
jgi:hypothetical protein